VNFALKGKFEFSAGGKRINKRAYTKQNFNFDKVTKSQSAM